MSGLIPEGEEQLCLPNFCFDYYNWQISSAVVVSWRNLFVPKFLINCISVKHHCQIGTRMSCSIAVLQSHHFSVLQDCRSPIESERLLLACHLHQLVCCWLTSCKSVLAFRHHTFITSRETSHLFLSLGEYRNPLINTAPIVTTLIITVKIFVTTAWLAWGQTLVITVKISAPKEYKIVSASECKKHPCMCKYFAPMGIEDVQVSVQGNKIINCHKTSLATLAQNRFQPLTLHPWE